MALPVGVTTATLTFGVPVSFTGGAVRSTVSIVPSASLVHTATGTPLVNFIEDVITSEGVSGQFTLPHTDQLGFQDESGNSYQNWYYTATISYSAGKTTLPSRTKTFQLPSGQTTVDLDLLPAGAPVLPYTAQTAVVTSFGGRTNAVTLQESDLPARLSDTSLNATIASQTEPVFAKRRFPNSNAPFAKTSRALNGYQAKGYDPVDDLMWYADSANLVTSADHGVTLSAAKALPSGVVATGIKKVVRAGSYIWLGAIDSGDGRTKVWRAPVADPYVWSASLVTMTANGGLLSTGMSADAAYVYIGDYADPTGGAHVWRGDVTTGVFTDVTPTGIIRHVHAITADPYNAGHVWMTTGDSGARLYRSTNYGQTWTLLNSEWQAVQISFTPEWVYLAADSAVASVLVVDRDTLQTLVATPTWHYEIAVPGGAGSRVVTDLATNASGASPVVTSATANFTAADIGRRINHSRTVDPMTYIIGVTNSTTATLSNNSWGAAATGLTGTIFGDQFYDKAFYGAVDPATGVYYCIANDNSGKGTRSGLFMLPGVGEPLQLVQTFNSQIAGEVFIADGYLHSHEVVRPLMTFA